MNAIFSRASVRDFLTTPLSNEQIDSLLRAGMAAPSAGNQQPWEFYVVQSQGLLYSLSKVSPYAYPAQKAPCAIVPCYRTSALRFAPYAQIDMSACCQNLLLQAVELGLGAVWLGIAPEHDRMQMVKTILRLPEGIEPFAIIPVGYPQKEVRPQDRYNPHRIHFVEE